MQEEVVLSPYLRRFMPANQRLVACIKRHIVGLVYIYLIIIAATAALIAILAATASDLLEGFSGQGASPLTFITFLSVLLVVIILLLVTNIYRNNSLLITDQETIQVLQAGVFQVKVSNLSHADIEDVTAEQNGLPATIFNYGTLHIETSGELKNFVFKYCPDPARYARVVLDERQKFNRLPGNQ